MGKIINYIKESLDLINPSCSSIGRCGNITPYSNPIPGRFLAQVVKKGNFYRGDV